MDAVAESRARTAAETARNARPVFVLEQVCMNFSRAEVLKDLNLTVTEGERIAVIGPSGAGKTTLFRLLSAVLRPSSGKITALGQDTAALRGRALARLRRNIGVLYQNDNLIPHLRVVHNVLMGRLGRWMFLRALLSLIWPQELDRAKEALAELELADKLWAMPGELSGGQQQRVAIARLMLQQPRVMLADEPVSQLDLRLGREIIELLCSMATRTGATLMINLHSLELLRGHFTRVIAIREGRIFWDGRPGRLTREMLHDLYGAEYRALLLEDVRLENDQP